jgi:hypothetical protein
MSVGGGERGDENGILVLKYDDGVTSSVAKACRGTVLGNALAASSVNQASNGHPSDDRFMLVGGGVSGGENGIPVLGYGDGLGMATLKVTNG